MPRRFPQRTHMRRLAVWVPAVRMHMRAYSPPMRQAHGAGGAIMRRIRARGRHTQGHISHGPHIALALYVCSAFETMAHRFLWALCSTSFLLIWWNQLLLNPLFIIRFFNLNRLLLNQSLYSRTSVLFCDRTAVVSAFAVRQLNNPYSTWVR